MKIVTAAEMREIDRLTSSRYRVPSLDLMENAGTAVAEIVLANYPAAETVGVVCGKGNNGGDGFVAARKLHEAGKDVRVLLLAQPRELKGDAARMFKQLPVKPVAVRSKADFKRSAAADVFGCDVLVDAILGTGFHPPMTGLYADAITKLWQARRPIVAVDIPSGMTADYDEAQPVSPRAPAAEIVSFTAAKPRLVFDGALAAVPSVIAQIGSPDEAIVSTLGLNVTTASDVLNSIPPRAVHSHKGTYGHVLVIGGSLGKSGAPAMAGIAALRSGAGLVTVAAPRSQIASIAAHAPELMTEPLDETADGTISLRSLEGDGVARLLAGKTVIALGPGISTNPETQEFVRKLLTISSMPVVLDADGLNAFAGRVQEIQGRGTAGLVLTPHPGEMARLLDCSIEDVQRDRIGTARHFAVEHNVVIVLKGHRTLVAHPDGRIWVNTTGNPALAKGGTGDALTGVAAGLLAQNVGRNLGIFVELPTAQQEQGRAILRKLKKGVSGDKLLRQLTERERNILQPIMESSKKLADARESLRLLLPAIAAVYLHGLAGDIAREQLDENCVLATDVIAALPQAFRLARERAQSEPRFTRIN